MADPGGNRSDLVMSPDRSPGAPSASTHGQQAAKAEQRRALPQPGARGPAVRPTERPSEPVTAGLSIGPGPGPVAGGVQPIDRVRAAYARLPSSHLRRLLEVMERAEAR